MRYSILILAFLMTAGASPLQAEEKPAEFKSAEMNVEMNKLPALAATLQTLVEARMHVARGELIEKLKAYQIKTTQDGDLDEALKVRDTIAELETLQAAHEKRGTKEAPSKPVKVSIPKDAVRFGKNKYFLVTEPKTWADAKKLCEEQGGHLARIESAEEHAFCAKLIQMYRPATKNDRWIWIDGADEALEATYLYSNGKEVKYLKWDAMKPNAGSTFNWLTLDVTTGLFHDADSQKRPFICEWD